jgi:hypothetical protein
MYSTTCGDEKISVNETMISYGVGIPGGMRHNFTMNETQVACKVNCMFVHEWQISDTLVSSNPNCPITDLKVMEDDG